MEKHKLNRSKIKWEIALTSLLLFVTPSTNAQSDSQTLESLRACQNVPELSSRLSCYDQILPPSAETLDSDNSFASREELAATVAKYEQQEELETSAEIIEIQKPSLRTSRLLAADGRVFVQSKATTTTQWPEVPFNIEIESSLFGSTKYIKIPGRRDRIRISIEY